MLDVGPPIPGNLLQFTCLLTAIYMSPQSTSSTLKCCDDEVVFYKI